MSSHPHFPSGASLLVFHKFGSKALPFIKTPFIKFKDMEQLRIISHFSVWFETRACCWLYFSKLWLFLQTRIHSSGSTYNIKCLIKAMISMTSIMAFKIKLQFRTKWKILYFFMKNWFTILETATLTFN